MREDKPSLVCFGGGGGGGGGGGEDFVKPVSKAPVIAPARKHPTAAPPAIIGVMTKSSSAMSSTFIGSL
eukprot:CAMPEP_0167757656 /NCGR_PEP_ID=MMETSP0110_2-20121227/10044_1 /TAXON_ID=629695 /ORGANISM="Gymnochlora sp., Strain CCMP2014" /LENGTH=68 /DNA_ID=CAMNT_0007643865 /DNA_START=473 /DNA_END=679 /DNA_ORIENTATION=+